MLTINNLVHVYGNGTRALDDVSLTVNGSTISYQVASSDVVVGDAQATRNRVALGLAQAINAQAPKLVKAANAVSSTVLVSCFNKPSGPVSDKPCSLAWRTSSTPSWSGRPRSTKNTLALDESACPHAWARLAECPNSRHDGRCSNV